MSGWWAKQKCVRGWGAYGIGLGEGLVMWGAGIRGLGFRILGSHAQPLSREPVQTLGRLH